jgi:uncharacterized protein YbcC (UPF0753/DUF2309 family)
MFSLTNIKKAYPLVEISGSKVPQSYKESIYNELNSSLNRLNIDTKGYNQRAVAILVNEFYVGKLPIINMQLLIGEQVKRLDNNKTFAMTYQSQEHFVLEDEEELEEQIEDTVDSLLSKFSEQYKEENRAIVKVERKQEDFATAMHYETDYKKALTKAKKENKNVHFVLDANYCPSSRKFEERVLMKKDLNELIHKKYVPLILNREKGNFPKEFSKEMTPIVHFINAKTEKSYHNVVGYNNREEFLFLLKSDK